MKFCLKSKSVRVYLYYTFRFSSWKRKDRKYYNSLFFSFKEAYFGFKNTEWFPYDKGFIIFGIKIFIDIY